MVVMSFLAAGKSDPSDALPYLVLLCVVIFVGGLLLMLYRAKLKKKYEQPENFGFTLADLKKLRDNGELSEQEFEVAKNKMLAKLNVNLAGKGKKQSGKDPGEQKVEV